MSPNSEPTVNNIGKNCLIIPALVWVALFFLHPPLCPAQNGPQPPLPTTELRIGTKKITAEIADEAHERSAGLMFRKSLASDSGMLFVMDRIAPVGFWMKNTQVPLTIAYIDPAGVIKELHDLEPHNQTPVPSRFPNIAYALEMPQGWFTKNNIWPGERLEGLPKPTAPNP
ncbi:MAG: hypothetical protein RL630_80 [Verrucomicrobiota bacterium]